MTGTTGNAAAPGGETVEAPAVVEPVVNTATVSLADYLAAAPAELQGVLQEQMRVHANRKAELIAGLKACATNSFTDEQLASFDMAVLESMSKLASVPTFEGLGAPAPTSLTVNAGAGVAAFAKSNRDYLKPAAAEAA